VSAMHIYYRVIAAASCLALPLAAVAADSKAGAAKGVAMEPVSMGNVVQLVIALVVVLLAIAGVGWMVRRLGRFPAGTSGVLKVLGGLAMGQRERVVLLQVGDKQLLVGVAPGRIETLYVLDEPLAVADGAAPVMKGFSKRLSAAIKQRAATS